MQKSRGLTALEIINPNQRIGEWLRGLAGRNIISPDTMREASSQFQISRSFEDWGLFLRRFFILMGVLLITAGFIFFMAWNWEDMSRFDKFAILEAVFIIFAAYSVLRWNSGPDGGTGWDARIALLGVAIMVGGLMALYGQIYQTGADPWELFRAWAFVLLLIALPGRATVFWFMLWLVGNTWLILYLQEVLSYRFYRSEILLILALVQFTLLALNEAAAHLAAGRSWSYDSGRWLSRIIGCSAIVIMAAYGITLAINELGFDHRSYYGEAFLGSDIGIILYLASLGAIFAIYYLRLPELVFLTLSIFSFAAFIGTSLIRGLIDGGLGDLSIFLPIGLIIIGCAFGALKLLLIVRSKIRERAVAENTAGIAALRNISSLFQFRSSEGKKLELKNWLVRNNAASPEVLDAYFADDETERENCEPWYARVFVTIGVWLGSGALLAFVTSVILEGMIHSPQPLGVIGLIFCGLSLQMGTGKKLSGRAFSQVLGVCGLIYAAMLMDFELRPTLFLLCLLFGVFWALKPPYLGRIAAFLGMLVCLFWFLDADTFSRYSYYSDEPGALAYAKAYAKTIMCCLGFLWATHYLVVMQGEPPARLLAMSEGGWLRRRFVPEEVLGSSALGCLIFFAAAAILAQSGGFNTHIFWLNFRLAGAATFAILTALLCWRYPASRALTLPLGLILAVVAWFAPVLAIGLGLVFLAFQWGQPAFLGAAVVYLGLAHWTYYYTLQLSLLYKSLVLMAVGLGLLILGLSMHLLAKQLKGLVKS